MVEDVTEPTHIVFAINFSRLLETLSDPALFLLFDFSNASAIIVGVTLQNTNCSLHGFERKLE